MIEILLKNQLDNYGKLNNSGVGINIKPVPTVVNQWYINNDTIQQIRTLSEQTDMVTFLRSFFGGTDSDFSADLSYDNSNIHDSLIGSAISNIFHINIDTDNNS